MALTTKNDLVFVFHDTHTCATARQRAIMRKGLQYFWMFIVTIYRRIDSQWLQCGVSTRDGLYEAWYRLFASNLNLAKL